MTFPMPIKTVRIELEEADYPGWWIDMRLNPRSKYYDMFFEDDPEKSWEGFKHIVTAWNWADEDGATLPLPADGLLREDLPTDIPMAYIFAEYVSALREKAGLPRLTLESGTPPDVGAVQAGVAADDP